MCTEVMLFYTNGFSLLTGSFNLARALVEVKGVLVFGRVNQH